MVCPDGGIAKQEVLIVKLLRYFDPPAQPASVPSIPAATAVRSQHCCIYRRGLGQRFNS